MRTRGNGQPLSEQGILEDARNAVDGTDFYEVEKDLRALISSKTREAFDAGMQLGAKVEHRVAVEAIQQAALTVLGKDRGDGAIDLGALGTDVYKEV